MPYFVFSTAIGACGIAWDASGITAFQLPEKSEADTRRRLASRIDASEAPSSPPVAIAEVIRQAQEHLSGKFKSFRDAPLAWAQVSEFRRRVYQAAAEIPPGSCVSYGELACRIGAPAGTARAIGGAMAANPWPLLIPCHRIVGARGTLTGFSGFGGIKTKARLLEIEGAILPVGC